MVERTYEDEINGSTSKYIYSSDLDGLFEYFFVSVVIHTQRVGTDRLVFGIPFGNKSIEGELEKKPYYPSFNSEHFAFCIESLYSKSGLGPFINFSSMEGFKFDCTWEDNADNDIFFPSFFFSYEIGVTYTEFRELVWLILIEFKDSGGNWDRFLSSRTLEYVRYRLCGMANFNDIRGLAVFLSEWMQKVNPGPKYERWCYGIIRGWSYYFVEFQIFRLVDTMDRVYVNAFIGYCSYGWTDFDSLPNIEISNRIFSIDILKYGVGVDISTVSINEGIKSSRRNIYLPTFNSKVYFPLFRSFEGIGMFKEFGHHIVQSSVLNSSEVNRWDHICNYFAFSNSKFVGMPECFDHYAFFGSWDSYSYGSSDFLVLMDFMDIYCHDDSWIIETGSYSNLWRSWDSRLYREHSTNFESFYS